MKLSLLLCSILLTACSNLSPTIKNAPSVDIHYGDVKKDVDRFRGSPVRWGGTIIDVENEENYSQVQVLYYPLNSYGRPRLGRKNEGRFLIKTKKFLDPEVYAKGTSITVAGTLSGEIDRKVGNKSVVLPLVVSDDDHLWSNYRRRPRYDGGYWGYPRSGFYGFYPYYGLSRGSRFRACY